LVHSIGEAHPTEKREQVFSGSAFCSGTKEKRGGKKGVLIIVAGKGGRRIAEPTYSERISSRSPLSKKRKRKPFTLCQSVLYYWKKELDETPF